MWDEEEVAGDLELLKAFLRLRNPLDALRFGVAEPGFREPNPEEIYRRARLFGYAAVKLGRGEDEIDGLLALIAKRRDEAMELCGHSPAGTPNQADANRADWFLAAERVAMVSPLPLAGLVGLAFFAAAGVLAGLVVQPQYVPVVRSLLFAAGFLSAFNRLFMPVPWESWIRAFAWLSLPSLAWITLSRLGRLAPADRVLNPGFLPFVPWAMAFLGICLGVRILRGAARREGLGATLVYFDASVSRALPASTLALPSGTGLVRPVDRRGQNGDRWRALVSLVLVVAGIGGAIWTEGSGAAREAAERKLAAEAALRREREAKDAEIRKVRQERREAEARRAREVAEAEKARAAKDEEVRALKERVERERKEKERKQAEIDRLNATETTKLETPTVLFVMPYGEADPAKAKSIVQLAPDGWEMLTETSTVIGGTTRAIVRGRHRRVGEEMALLPDSIASDEPDDRVFFEAKLPRYALSLKGGLYHPNRKERFRPVDLVFDSGATTSGYRWSPDRASAPAGDYVALNPKAGTEVRLSLKGDYATVAATPSGESWKASYDRRDGYGRLRSNESNLPALAVWDEGARRLYLYLGPSLGGQPFVLVMQSQEDYNKR